MVNLSVLSTVGVAAGALSNLVLVSPQKVVGYQPMNKDGTMTSGTALLFHYEGQNDVTLESDITDHYVEDNTAVQDQIALKPEKISVHGFIGELNDIAPKALQVLQTIANKLTVISAYTPAISTTALIAYNTAFQLYQTTQNAINSAISSWSSVTGQGGTSTIGSTGLTVQKNQTKQQLMFQQFYGYWRNRTHFTVQTPWAIFQNCAIQSLRAIQEADTNVVTDFEVTFKLIRVASTTEIVSTTSGQLSSQAARPVDNGAQTLTPGLSLTSGLSSMGVIA
jgi:hypothetical protein